MTEYTTSGEGAIAAATGNMAWDVYDADGTQRVKKVTASQLASYINSVAEANTALTTVGAGTLTAAALLGRVITRSGSTGAYTDTTDTAANIIAALPSAAPVGTAVEITIKNTVAFAQTLAGGSGVTLSGQTVIPPDSWGRFLLTYNGAGTCTLQGLSIDPLSSPPLEANTAITTVGAGTLTAAALAGDVITRSGSTAAYTDTTDTAANIVAAVPNASIGQSWEVTIKNTVAFAQTLAGGTSVTLSGQTVIPPNSAGRFLLTYNGTGTVTMQGLMVVPLTTNALDVATPLTTVGAGTITGAGIAGGVTTRSGPTSAFTDTSDTAANIIAGAPNANIGQSWEWTYRNSTNFLGTLAGGTGVTFSNIAAVAANSWARFLVTYTAAATVTIAGIAEGPNASYPDAQYSTAALQSTVLLAANMAGAKVVCFENTGTTPGNLQSDTAANIVAAIPNAQLGMSYLLKVRNSSGSANTATITTNTGITLHGTMTIAQNVTRDFLVQLTSLSAVDIYSMGISGTGA